MKNKKIKNVSFLKKFSIIIHYYLQCYDYYYFNEIYLI